MKRFITLLAAALMSVGMSWAMQIYIDVPEQDLLAIDVEPSDGIENVKGKIQDKTSIPPEYQTLYFNSTLLEDDRSLADYNILNESTLQLAISGGSTDVIPCTTADLGKVLCTDGSIYATVSEATAASKTAAAVITYVDTENAKALALALTDDGGEMEWATAKTTAPAHTPAVSGGTWTLASKDDWNNMITAAGGYEALRDCFSSVGGTNMQQDVYWSSTPVDYYAWIFYFDDGRWVDGYLDYPCRVRACLAFDIPAAPQPEPAGTVWTALKVGDVIKVGDKIEVPAEGDGSWGINGNVLRNTWGPYELIRADIYQASESDDPMVTETEDGAFYVFKAENSDFYPFSNLAKGGGLVVTGISDGLVVTAAANKEFTVAVHEKADDPTTYTLTLDVNDLAMGTVSVEVVEQGDAEPIEGEIETIEFSNIPAEWADNKTPLSAADLPGFVAVTGEEALALAADLKIISGIIVYGFDGESVATVQINNDNKRLQDVNYTKKIIARFPSISAQVFYTGVPVSTNIVDNGDGTYTVTAGTEVTIVAQPAEGYHLASWSNDAALNENDTQTITITSDTTITAVFAADVVTPVANVDAENAETKVWFDLSGRRLQSKPTTPGLYIRNGKKALVK